MKSLLLNDNGDLVFEGGSFVLIEGDEELSQQVRLALSTQKNEWFLDPEEGMNREPLLRKNFNENDAKESIIESLEELSESLQVEDIEFKRAGRILTVSLKLIKENGETLTVEEVGI